MHGVAGLGVAALKVEQVAGFEADAGAGESDAGWSENAQSRGQGLSETGIGMRGVVHDVSSLSG